MAITDPAAIKFCNEQIRPAADRLARCYYRSKELSEAWGALTGTTQEKFDLLKNDILKVATLISNTWFFCFKSELIYDSGSIASALLNEATEEIWDNSGNTAQDPTRPPLTGQDARRVKNRMEEFVNFLARGTDLDKHWNNEQTATLPVIYDYYKHVGRLANDSAKEPTPGWGQTLANQRCVDVVTEYETTSPNSLPHILRAAVNPEPTPVI